MKYIIYLTTNLVNKKIYIGVHKTENPYKFDGYLGNGVKVNDRSTYRFNHTPFESAVNKYGPSNFIRKTLKVFDTLEEALEEEKKLVNEEFIKRKDTYNITLGGGIPPIKCKVIYQYDLEGNFIKEWDSITEASIFYKCSSSCIGKSIFDRTPSIGYLWSENKFDKLDIETFKIDQNKTKCYLYDINGEFVNEFNSLTECAKFINSSCNSVSNAVKGKFSIKNQWYCSDIKVDKFIPYECNNFKDKHLYQYDLEGNFIKEWNSYYEVTQYFKKQLWIHSAIRLGRTCEGFQWSWEYVPCMKNLQVTPKAKKVGKFTINGKLVQTFNTVRDAKKDTCGAPNVLSGKRKTAGGFIWKYL